MKTRLRGNFSLSPLIQSMCFVLFITTFFSGCVGVPIPKNDARSLAKKDIVKNLIGESQESVINELGLPDLWVSQGERQFMTYSVSSARNIVPVIFLIPVGVFEDTDAGAGRTLHCYRIEIDSNNMVKNYKIDSTARGGRYHSCRNLLTNDWELPNLEIRKVVNVNSQAQFKEGDLIRMTTNKEITIASTKVTSLKIVVVESDSTKIKGRLSGFLSYVDETMENEIGSIVEIMREDIEKIWSVYYRPPGLFKSHY